MTHTIDFNKQYYQNYELTLLKTIMNMEKLIQDTNDNNFDFFSDQIIILKRRLSDVQKNLEKDNIKSHDTSTNQTQEYMEHDEILVNHFDHPQPINTTSEESKEVLFYSLRSWIEYYFKLDYFKAYQLAKNHCNQIKKRYLEKYKTDPIKVCKEWIYENNSRDAIKEVLVSSFSKLEFMDIVKPYFDEYFDTEGHL